MIKLNYLVLYSKDIELLREFYEKLGLIFQPEKHGEGKEHYSTKMGDGIILELYPSADASCGKQRLGLTVDDLESVVNRVESNFPFSVKSRSDDRVIIVDPDYRIVELSSENAENN